MRGISSGKGHSKINKNYYGYIFTAPFIIVYLVFSLYPLLYTFYLSMTNMIIMSGSNYDFIWFDNFRQLFEDDYFVTSVANTWKIWLINFIPQLGIAMLLSVWFMNERLKIRFIGLWRTVYYLPNLLMPVAVAALYFNLFHMYGPVNQVLYRLGLVDAPIDFFRSSGWTQSIVAYIQWWMWFGVTILYIMAGMSSISVTYYEAALVDGASSWRMFTDITLPLLKPVLTYILVTSAAGGMQMFDIPYLLTDGRGSPNRSIMTMGILMYMRFSSGKGFIGAGASVAVMIFIITAISSFIIMRLLREKD